MQTLSRDQLVGRSVGKYQIERLLGRGKLGAAYVAQQLEQDRTAMITVFDLPEGISAQEREQFNIRFAQQGTALVRLIHPNILPIYDCGELSGCPYLVTAFVKDASLGHLMKERGHFTLQQTLAVFKQIASALDYAHSNAVVHDLLSLSMLIHQETVQVAGFGLRSIFELHRDTLGEKFQGSLPIRILLAKSEAHPIKLLFW